MPLRISDVLIGHKGTYQKQECCGSRINSQNKAVQEFRLDLPILGAEIH